MAAPQAGPSAAAPALDVVVLAGGVGRRLGGVDKALLELPDHRSLLAHIVAACPPQARVLVVGPQRDLPGDVASRVRWCREDPPGTGPLAGLAAALPLGRAPLVLVVGTDMPAAPAALPALLGGLDARPDAGAAVLLDQNGRPQPLAALHRRSALAARLTEIGDPRNRPLRLVLQGQPLATLPDTWAATQDIDTWDDARRLGARLVGPAGGTANPQQPNNLRRTL